MSTQCRSDMRPQDPPLAAWKPLRVLWLLLCCCLIVGALTPAQAQRRQMQLSLREATAFALQQNLDIQIVGITPRIREAQVTEEKGIFDVEARAGLQATGDRLLGTSATFQKKPKVDGLVGQDTTDEAELSLGINQLTPYGGTYEINVSGIYEETERRVLATLEPELGGRGDPNPEFYTTEVELKVIQPILRDFGSTVTQNQILIAQNNLAISQEDFRRQVIASTSQVQQTYWDLVFRREDLEVRRQQMALAQRLLNQVRRQVEVGTLAPIEVLQAETEIASVKQTIILAANAVRNAEDRLKRIMNLSLIGEFANVEILPEDAAIYAPLVLDQETEIREALDQRFDLIQAKLELENQNITLIFNKNQTLPTLDFEASLTFNGIDDNFGGGIEQMRTGRHRWEVGLVFRYPLANRQAKSRLQQSRLAIRQQLLRIKNLEETIMEEVRNAVRAVQASAELVQASRAATRLSERQLEAEEKKLQVGLATVFTVLDFQEDLSVQRSAEIRSLTAHQQALVRLEEVKNTLLQSYNIVIQGDGPRLQ